MFLYFKKLTLSMEKKEVFGFWDYLILVGAAIILLWASLKAIGIIHSPVWVEMVPYFGGGISIIGAAYKLGKIKKGIEETDKKVEKILLLEERFNKIETEHNLALEGKLNCLSFRSKSS
jgi:hypothetical protein